MNSTDKDRAGTVSKVTPRKLNQAQNRRVTLISSTFFIAILCAAALSLLSYANDNTNTLLSEEKQDAEYNYALAGTIEDMYMDSNASDKLTIELYSQYYFFERDRMQRYLAYQAANPELDPEQVVVRVNMDLDTPAYEMTSPASDPESLLVLTSKHYYLPYDYKPPDLVETNGVTLRAQAAQALEQLLVAAEADGIELSPSSAYRDAIYQETLYNNYSNTFGTEWTDVQSARPCFSEHQTGWAVDFSPADEQFYDTPQAYWLVENAHLYGFIVRYKEECTNITLFIHEPWHLRYVGTEVSLFMHDNAIDSFEEYFVKYVQHTPPVAEQEN